MQDESTVPTSEQGTLTSVTETANALIEKFKTTICITLNSSQEFEFDLETEDKEQLQELENSVCHEIAYIQETKGELFLGNWSDFIKEIRLNGVKKHFQYVNHTIHSNVISYYNIIFHEPAAIPDTAQW